MKVRCGLMTAAEAARQLGVSRKTYYKWEQRGLSALLDGLSDQPPGRPEKEEASARAMFEKQMTALRRENELLEQKLVLKDLAFDLRIRSSKDRRKKK
jgi:transposase-like protein